jgi:hypothetical protein
VRKIFVIAAILGTMSQLSFAVEVNANQRSMLNLLLQEVANSNGFAILTSNVDYVETTLRTVRNEKPKANLIVAKGDLLVEDSNGNKRICLAVLAADGQTLEIRPFTIICN